MQDEKKLAAFKALVGDEVAETALNQASVSTKEARQAGIREKAQEPGNGPETLESIQAQIAALSGQIASFKSKEEPVTNAKAAGTPPVQEPSTIAEKDDGEEPDGDEGMGEGDGDGDEMYIGDMTAPEFTAVLQQALAPLFEGVNKSFDLHTKIGDVHKAMGEMKQYLGGLTQKDSSNAELEETRQTLQQAMITMKAMKEQLDATAQELQDLQGTMPRAATRPQGTAYKASEAVDNTIPPGSPIFQAPIGAEQGSQVQMSPLSWIDQFVVAQQSAPAQAGVQPAVVIPQQ